MCECMRSCEFNFRARTAAAHEGGGARCAPIRGLLRQTLENNGGGFAERTAQFLQILPPRESHHLTHGHHRPLSMHVCCNANLYKSVSIGVSCAGHPARCQ